jgi:chromate transporter
LHTPLNTMPAQPPADTGSTALPCNDANDLQRPHSRTDLFVSFTWLALQGFGGVLAVVQRELVEKKRWMTREQFVEEWAVAQIMPGPNVVNLSMMIGGRYFGLSGALAALGGMLAAPLAIVLVVAALFGGVSETPVAQGALRGMGAVAAGLIAATGLKLMSALVRNPMGMPACVALATLTFAGVALLRWPLAWVLLGVGGLACAWAWQKLGAPAAGEQA